MSTQLSGGATGVPSASSSLDALPTEALEQIASPAAAATKPPGALRSLFNSQLESNPYFSAGFGLMAVGVSLTFLRRSLVVGSSLAQRRMLVSLEISSKDPAYLWFLKWMSVQTSQRQLATEVAGGSARGWIEGLAARVKSHELAVETKYEMRNDGSSKAEFALVPGPGTHYFRYEGAWFQVKRERATNMLDLNSGTPWETLSLTTLSRDRTLFPSLLLEARHLAQAAVEGHTIIYTAWGADWKPFGRPRMRRAIGSVVLDEGVADRIRNDVVAFMGRGKWYFERGIPYRRGYLLHGPPGSGKSSFIQALAGSLEYNICVLNLSERGLTDDKLNHLLANAPERTLILLEDIDAAFSGRRQSGEAGFSGSVTFSGLLNALDGVASSTSQRILFMTTNHLELLDPALIRPGRVDLKELISDATPFQASELFRRFYAGGDLSDDEVERLREELAKKVGEAEKSGERISMAALQGHFIRNGPREAVDGLEELVRTGKEDQEARVRFSSSP
ncbi:hypothetical protein RQP46_010244 [Phenoliferia psychrophenolica]